MSCALVTLLASTLALSMTTPEQSDDEDPWTFSAEDLEALEEEPADPEPASPEPVPADLVEDPAEAAADVAEPSLADADGVDEPPEGGSGGQAQEAAPPDPWLSVAAGAEEDPFAGLDDERVASWEEAPAPAPTAVSAPPAPEGTLHERGGQLGLGLVLGAKAGVGRAGASEDGLGWTPAVELELGYSPPLPAPFRRDLQLFTTAAYAAPSLSGEQRDARLGAEPRWSYQLTLHQLVTAAGLLYRVPLPLPWLRPYASLGVRSYLGWAVVGARTSSSALPSVTEVSLNAGAGGSVGADLFIGPGAALAELQAGVAFVDGRVLSGSQGTLNLVVGYRLLL